MWGDEDKHGKRELQIQRCLEMDWNNPKEITIWEIAWCINQYDDINITSKNLTKNRQSSIKKKIDKILQDRIKKQKEEEAIEEKQKLIAKIAAIVCIEPLDKFTCELLDIDFDETDTHTQIFNPEWFNNTESANEAIFITSMLSNGITKMIMENGTRFRDGKFPQDLDAAITATKNLIKAYEKVGISPSLTKSVLKTIPYEPPKTIKQYLMDEREYWIEYFTKLGNTKTNATLIATRITLLAEQSIPLTAKHQF